MQCLQLWIDVRHHTGACAARAVLHDQVAGACERVSNDGTFVCAIVSNDGVVERKNVRVVHPNDHNASARSRGLIATDRAILDVRWAVVRKDCAARVAAIVCTYPPSHGIVVEGTIMDGQSAAVVENGAAEGSAAATAAVAAIPTEATTGAGTGPAHALTISTTNTKPAVTTIADATVTIAAATTTAEDTITTNANAPQRPPAVATHATIKVA